MGTYRFFLSEPFKNDVYIVNVDKFCGYIDIYEISQRFVMIKEGYNWKLLTYYAYDQWRL